ncbi:MAG: hypothetical protein WC829_09985 [Hyphomicrobium sp.]|jgi:hypothetical protein
MSRLFNSAIFLTALVVAISLIVGYCTERYADVIWQFLAAVS